MEAGAANPAASTGCHNSAVPDAGCTASSPVAAADSCCYCCYTADSGEAKSTADVQVATSCRTDWDCIDLLAAVAVAGESTHMVLVIAYHHHSAGIEV